MVKWKSIYGMISIDLNFFCMLITKPNRFIEVFLYHLILYKKQKKLVFLLKLSILTFLFLIELNKKAND
jgi:hypothetical protein